MGGAYAVAAAPDGTGWLYAAAGWGFSSTNGVTVVCDNQLGLRQPLTNSGSRFAFSPDGKLLATGTWVDKIKLWAWPNLQMIGEFGPVGGIASIHFSPDGRRLVCGSTAGELTLWDVEKRVLIRRMEVHPLTTVGATRFSPDGRWLVTAGGDQTIVIRDANTSEPVRVLRGYADRIHQVEWTPDSRSVVSTTMDAGLRVWTVENPEVRAAPLPALRRRMRFSPDSSFLAIECEPPRAVVLASARTGREVKRMTGNLDLHGFLPSGDLVIEDMSQHRLRFCQVPSLEVIRELPIETVPAKTRPNADISADGKHLVRAALTGDIFIWNLNSGKLLHQLTEHRGEYTRVLFSHDGRWLLSCGQDGAAFLWDTSHFRKVASYAGTGVQCFNIGFSQDGRSVVVGWENGSHGVFDRAGGQLLYMAKSPEEGPGWLPDTGATLITHGYSHLRFWSVIGQREAGAVRLPGDIGRLSLSPNGTMLAAVVKQKTIHFWLAPSLPEIDRLPNW